VSRRVDRGRQGTAVTLDSGVLMYVLLKARSGDCNILNVLTKETCSLMLSVRIELHLAHASPKVRQVRGNSERTMGHRTRRSGIYLTNPTPETTAVATALLARDQLRGFSQSDVQFMGTLAWFCVSSRPVAWSLGIASRLPRSLSLRWQTGSSSSSQLAWTTVSRTLQQRG
jgi:hypothetical protein